MMSMYLPWLLCTTFMSLHAVDLLATTVYKGQAVLLTTNCTAAGIDMMLPITVCDIAKLNGVAGWVDLILAGFSSGSPGMLTLYFMCNSIWKLFNQCIHVLSKWQSLERSPFSIVKSSVKLLSLESRFVGLDIDWSLKLNRLLSFSRRYLCISVSGSVRVRAGVSGSEWEWAGMSADKSGSVRVWAKIDKESDKNR